MKSAIQSLFDFDLVDSAGRFIKTLNKADTERGDRSGYKQKKTFAPSGLGYGKGRCPRFWYYAFNGADWVDKNDYRGLRNMENGTDRHDRFETLLQSFDNGLVIKTEEELRSDDPPVFGYVDGQIQWEGKRWVLEFKTKKSGQYKKLRASGKPPLYNIIQILVYMHILRYKYGMLIYEDKETHDMFAVPIVMEGTIKEYTKELVDWMNLVYDTVTQEDAPLPERVFTEKSKECKYCPLKQHCWDGEEGEVQLPRQPLLKI